MDTWMRLQSKLDLFLNIRLHYQGDLEKVPETHRNILKAIKQRNAQMAEEYMRHHIEQIGSLIIGKIREEFSGSGKKPHRSMAFHTSARASITSPILGAARANNVLKEKGGDQ